MQTPVISTPTRTEHPLDKFHTTVPQHVKQKLIDLAEHAEDFISDPYQTRHWLEPYGTASTNPIYGYDPGGFIPFQDGGVEVNEFYRCDMDSTYWFTEKQAEYMYEFEKDMYKCMAHDLELPEDWDYDALPRDKQNEICEYENEWFDPALLRLEAWVEGYHRGGCDKDGPHFYLRVSLNYRDAPYYRTKYDDTLCSMGPITVDEFMNTPNEQIIDQLRDLMEKVK